MYQEQKSIEADSPMPTETQSEAEQRRKDLDQQGIIVINEPFTDKLAETVIHKLYAMDKNKLIDEISIHINSHGGSVWALFGITDAMQQIKKPVNTFCFGKAYSAGAFLLMAGTGRREAFARCDILIHDVSTYFGYAKNAHIQIDAKRLSRINKMLEDHLKQHTKLTKKDIDLFLNSNLDIFLTSQEALKYGIIDKII